MAVKDEMVGSACTTVAAQVVVAMVEDASTAKSVIEYVPGVTAMVCNGDVLPLPQRNATGAIPPAEEAVQAILEADGTPLQEVVNAEAALAVAIESINAAVAAEMAIFCNFIFIIELD